jgi:hypothetical protein
MFGFDIGFDANVEVNVAGLLETAQAVRHLGDCSVQATANLRDNTLYIRNGAESASWNLRQAAIISSAKLADTAKYISV